MKNFKPLFFCFLFLSILFFTSGCTKDEPVYDPTGKCGFVLSSTIGSAGLTAVWYIKISMDDGTIYNTVSSDPYAYGERVCF